MLTVGMEGTLSRVVQASMLADAMGSGELPVLATPALAALMEEAAWRLAAKELKEGETTVGVLLRLEHLAPSLPGKSVSVRARLCGCEGRRLRFLLEAETARGLIGRAEHERVVVDAARFLEKARPKL